MRANSGSGSSTDRHCRSGPGRAHVKITLHRTGGEIARLLPQATERGKQVVVLIEFPSRILAKMNAIVDPAIIEALYEASRAGVEIDLIVRGICCLRPGIPGVSERIRVVSLLGRFLEHSRAMVFRNGGREEIYIASADWMPRNLDRRVEAAVPIEDPRHRAEIRRLLELMLADRRQAWEMQPDGSYVQRVPGPGEDARGTHAVLVR